MNYQEIYNKAALAAIKCNKDKVKANQINQLLSIFNSNAMKDINNILMLLIAFVMRQTMRNLFKKESSDAITSTLKIIINEKIDEEDKKSETRGFLGLLKWFFEVSVKIRVDWNTREDHGFESVLNSFKSWVTSKGK